MIDIHTHIFPEKIAGSTLAFLESRCLITPATNGMEDGLHLSMEEASMDISVILPVVTKPSQFGSVLRFASRFAEGPLISFGGIHPDSGNYKAELREIKKAGLKGIKLHPDYQEVFIDDIRYKRIISYASELGLVITIHAGVDPGYPDCVHCTPKRARNVIDEIMPPKLILAHMGGFLRWDEAEEYLVGLPVWLDTAVVFGQIPDEQFLRIVKNHGSDRILFATDSPWGGQKASVKYLRDLPLSADDKEWILDGNARVLLGL